MKLFQWANLDKSLRASAKRSGHHQLFCGFNTNLHEEETGLAFCVAVLAQIRDSLDLLGSLTLNLESQDCRTDFFDSR